MTKGKIFDIGFNAVIGGKNVLAGKTISINLKKTTFFGVGPIWLTPEKYWAVVPDDLADNEYSIIHNAINMEHIVEGKTFIPPVDKASGVCEEYWLLIKEKGKHKIVVDKLRQLIRTGIDRNYTATEIIRFCIDKEKSSNNRPKVLELLEGGLGLCKGPARLYDPPTDDEEGKVTVIISSDGTIMDQKTKEVLNKPPKIPAPPAGHVKGKVSVKQKLNQILD